MNKYRWMIAISFLVLASFACQALSGGGSQAATSQAGGSGGGGGSGSGTNSSQFPMPSSVSNIQDMGNGSVNFQTKTSLKDVIAFYRDALTKKGYTERTATTAITDTTFNLVFDGDPNGKALVVQGLDLGNGTTNVNIRYESV
jgi:hypothetical protein